METSLDINEHSINRVKDPENDDQVVNKKYMG